MTTRAKNNIHKPLTKMNLTVVISQPSNIEPHTISQALTDPKWRQAMNDEFDARVRNETWELVPSTSMQNLVGCKWVFGIKRLPDGSTDRNSLCQHPSQNAQPVDCPFSPIDRLPPEPHNSGTFFGSTTASFTHQNIHSMTTRAKNNIHKPLTKMNLTVVISQPSNIEPHTISQALIDPKWRQAMNDGFDAHVRNGTWELVPSTSMQNLVGCKWVFGIKRLLDGSTDSLAVNKGWQLRQLDVNNAFIQGHLSKDVYMAQPPRFVDRDNPTHVCKLKKAIYGLKQAPQAWYLELCQFFIESGFTNSHAYTSLFILHSGDVTIYLLVYVDDIIITGTNTNIIQRYIDLLAQRFSIKDLGVLSYFLGIEVLTTPSSVLLTQRRYISDLLARTKMFGAKPIATPLVPNENLTLHLELDITLPTSPVIYCDNVGATYLCSNSVFHSRMKHINLSTLLLNRFHETASKNYESRLASPPELHLEGAYERIHYNKFLNEEGGRSKVHLQQYSRIQADTDYPLKRIILMQAAIKGFPRSFHMLIVMFLPWIRDFRSCMSRRFVDEDHEVFGGSGAQLHMNDEHLNALDES
ncbi:Retrovirus-related Pol polyprotein from transposon RE1 [Vitis vinifera]|uniref:Retrovirus-related Pol polyprotein from transposon RE1 n=1 Tax=Vitis vinifera TaxID=29760 RepID=A0A438DVB5_VITVI|nr:Retrovirus-related Pol polyprotein from transposon RE1 [Vitis vinifera]